MKEINLTLIIIIAWFTCRAQVCDTNLFPNRVEYYDTYHDVAADTAEWKHYNTHDPTMNKQGDWYYMYSTDAWWGTGMTHNGALKRRSKDLVNWEFLGSAFDSTPASAQNFFKITIDSVTNSGMNPSYTDNGIWAPYLLKYKSKYILYYSAPGGLDGVNYACIGYAYSDSAKGPWEDQGIITSSYLNTDTINAIDPTVIYDSTEQRLWMAYGSWYNGIYAVELDTATGGLKTAGDRGTKIACRKSSAYGQEGGEFTYHNGWYYLFESYDALGDLYNVRVGRAKHPYGPFYDYKGKGLTSKTNNVPMILSPYAFNDHPGWQGTGHCGVYNDEGQYYLFHQGRPSIISSMMVLHLRKIFWVEDWPLVSPERYEGDIADCGTVTTDSLLGTWEHLELQYHTSTASDFHSYSDSLHLYANGTFNSNSADTWTFADDTLNLTWSNGDIQKCVVFWGWDWENDCKALLYTGISNDGSCVWGKKVNKTESERYNTLTDGATYTIRSLYSHLLLQVTDNADVANKTVVQESDDESIKSQYWKIKSAGNGYYYLLPQHSSLNMALAIKNGSTQNYAKFVIDTLDGSDKFKFKLVYDDNGFYHILSKVSNNASCADLSGSSIYEGGSIIQYTYSEGLNQMWRFRKSDNYAIDTISIDTFTTTGITEQITGTQISIYPNPCNNGQLTVDLSSYQASDNVNFILFDLKGTAVYNQAFNAGSVHQLSINLDKGMYLVNVKSGKQNYYQKLIIQ